MAANQPDRGGPIRRVAITGGTHGNESNSVQLAKHLIRHPALAQRESFSSTVLLNNPAAIERNVRYCDEDLNRCFTLADLADESRNSIEAKRAREINAQLGPKGSEGAVDYVLDLHNTTANTGVAIMCSPHDRLSHALVAHLQAKDPSVRLLLWNRSVTDYPLMPSVGKHGMTFEVAKPNPKPKPKPNPIPIPIPNPNPTPNPNPNPNPKVPYFLISAKALRLDGTAPTLLYGYGGFEISLSPG